MLKKFSSRTTCTQFAFCRRCQDGFNLLYYYRSGITLSCMYVKISLYSLYWKEKVYLHCSMDCLWFHISYPFW